MLQVLLLVVVDGANYPDESEANIRELQDQKDESDFLSDAAEAFDDDDQNDEEENLELDPRADIVIPVPTERKIRVLTSSDRRRTTTARRRWTW